MAGSTMAASTETPYLHSGSLRGHDPVDAVFHHEAVGRSGVEPLSSKIKEIRGRLPVCNHNSAEYMRIEKLPEAGDFERMADAIGMTICGKTDRRVKRSEQLAYAIY